MQDSTMCLNSVETNTFLIYQPENIEKTSRKKRFDCALFGLQCNGKEVITRTENKMNEIFELVRLNLVFSYKTKTQDWQYIATKTLVYLSLLHIMYLHYFL